MENMSKNDSKSGFLMTNITFREENVTFFFYVTIPDSFFRVRQIGTALKNKCISADQP